MAYEMILWNGWGPNSVLQGDTKNRIKVTKVATPSDSLLITNFSMEQTEHLKKFDINIINTKIKIDLSDSTGVENFFIGVSSTDIPNNNEPENWAWYLNFNSNGVKSNSEVVYLSTGGYNYFEVIFSKKTVNGILVPAYNIVKSMKNADGSIDSSLSMYDSPQPVSLVPKDYYLFYTCEAIDPVEESYVYIEADFEGTAEISLTAGIPLNVYYRLNNLNLLLDPDYIINNLNTFNFSHPIALFDSNSNEYIYATNDKDEVQYINIDNSTYLRELILNQWLMEYPKYFEGILDYGNSIAENELNKLKGLLLKKSVAVNSYKGVKRQIEFTTSVYGEATNRHLFSVEPSPYYNFVYVVSSDITLAEWKNNIKQVVHPSGWSDVYVEIPPQGTTNYQPVIPFDESQVVRGKKSYSYVTFNCDEKPIYMNAVNNVLFEDMYSYREFDFPLYGSMSIDLVGDGTEGYNSAEFAELINRNDADDPDHPIDVFSYAIDQSGTDRDVATCIYALEGIATRYKWKVKTTTGLKVYEEETTSNRFTFSNEKADPQIMLLEITLYNNDWSIVLADKTIDFKNEINLQATAGDAEVTLTW